MKKLVVTVLYLLALCSISAQDSIIYGNSNYMYPFPADYNGFCNYYKKNSNVDGRTSREGTAFFCEGITNLPIYGVGVMLPSLGVTEDPEGYHYTFQYDIDIDNEYRSVVVCKLFGHSDTAGQEFWYVDFLDTMQYANLCRKHIVALQAQYNHALRPCQQVIHYVMFDYKLDSPIMINNDTLVLYSYTNRMDALNSAVLSTYNEYGRNHAYIIARIDELTWGPDMDTTMSQYYSLENPVQSIYVNSSGLYLNSFEGIFPILQPIVDTAGQGSGDTTAVDMVDGVGRYVSLTPNPAVDRVQVLSSFGLKQVEAYNVEGRLVYADEAHGLSKTIDLAAWPRGIYLIRIITPMGSTTKKLVLR